jgi:hypothetical protein
MSDCSILYLFKTEDWYLMIILTTTSSFGIAGFPPELTVIPNPYNRKLTDKIPAGWHYSRS